MIFETNFNIKKKRRNQSSTRKTDLLLIIFYFDIIIISIRLRENQQLACYVLSFQLIFYSNNYLFASFFFTIVLENTSTLVSIRDNYKNNNKFFKNLFVDTFNKKILN